MRKNNSGSVQPEPFFQKKHICLKTKKPTHPRIMKMFFFGFSLIEITISVCVCVCFCCLFLCYFTRLGRSFLPKRLWISFGFYFHRSIGSSLTWKLRLRNGGVVSREFRRRNLSIYVSIYLSIYLSIFQCMLIHMYEFEFRCSKAPWYIMFVGSLGGEGWLVSSIFRNFVRKSSTEMDSSKTILKLRGMFLLKKMFHQSKTEDFWAPTVSEPPSPP